MVPLRNITIQKDLGKQVLHTHTPLSGVAYRLTGDTSRRAIGLLVQGNRNMWRIVSVRIYLYKHGQRIQNFAVLKPN